MNREIEQALRYALLRLAVEPLAAIPARRRRARPGREPRWSDLWSQRQKRGEEKVHEPTEEDFPPVVRRWMRKELEAYRRAQERKWRRWLETVLTEEGRKKVLTRGRQRVYKSGEAQKRQTP